MMLQELLATSLHQQWFTSSYAKPLKTYVRKYAEALGHEANGCPPQVYHQPDEMVRDTLYKAADPDLQPRSVQACVNAVLKLLHRGVAEGCLPPLVPPPPRRKSLHRIYHPGTYLRRYHPQAATTQIPER